MAGTIKMFCIRMNILSHRNNIVLFLACKMATMQNLYSLVEVSGRGTVNVSVGWCQGGVQTLTFFRDKIFSFLLSSLVNEFLTIF